MHALHKAGLGIEDNLALALSPLVLGHETAGVGHGELEYGATGGILLRKAGPGHLRICIDHARNGVVLHLILLAKHVVYGDLRLADGRMGQHGESRDVACGIHARDVGAHMVIHLHAPAHFHAYVFKAEALDVGAAARAEQDPVPADALRLPVRIREAHFPAHYPADPASQVELHALLGVDAAEHGCLLRVHAAKDLRQHLHYGNLGPKAVEETCELHPDNAATYDHQAFRTLAQRQQFPCGHYCIARFRKPRDRRHRGRRSRAEKYPARLVVLPARLQGEPFGGLSADEGFLLYDLYPGVAHLYTHRAHQFLDHLVLAVGDLAIISADILCEYAVFLAQGRMLVQFGAIQKGLGGDTAFVQANSSQFRLFKQYHAEAVHGCLVRRVVSGRPSADYRKFVHRIKIKPRNLLTFAQSRKLRDCKLIMVQYYLKSIGAIS